MKYICHRGNITGPNPEQENHPNYINVALTSGFDVEIDVWYENDKFILGHDSPKFEINFQFFYNDRLWCHCKNIEALYKLSTNPLINSFFHNEDDATLTSKGFIWTFPRNLKLTNKSIAVMPERVENWDLSGAYGICTDFPLEYKKDLNFKLNSVKIASE